MRTIPRILPAVLRDVLGLDGSRKTVIRQVRSRNQVKRSFCAMLEYESHDDETLFYLRDYLRDPHKYEDVFVSREYGKRQRPKPLPIVLNYSA